MNNYVSPLSNSQTQQFPAADAELVIALHCSGGNVAQWRNLAQVLGNGFELCTPEHYGTGPGRSWPADKMLHMADEARDSLDVIDRATGKVHLVGHSYGGALALHIGLARPEKISTITMYEPCVFHLLPKLGCVAAAEMSEISALAAAILQHTREGNHGRAMCCFVDYWNGKGAWQGMKPEHKEKLMQWAPNAVNAFDALFSEESALSDYQSLKVPVQLIQGGLSPDPVRMLTSSLYRLLPDCRIDRLSEAGHMGPITHADAVNRLIATHIEAHAAHTVSAHIGAGMESVKVAVAA